MVFRIMSIRIFSSRVGAQLRSSVCVLRSTSALQPSTTTISLIQPQIYSLDQKRFKVIKKKDSGKKVGKKEQFFDEEDLEVE